MVDDIKQGAQNTNQTLGKAAEIEANAVISLINLLTEALRDAKARAKQVEQMREKERSQGDTREPIESVTGEVVWPDKQLPEAIVQNTEYMLVPVEFVETYRLRANVLGLEMFDQFTPKPMYPDHVGFLIDAKDHDKALEIRNEMGKAPILAAELSNPEQKQRADEREKQLMPGLKTEVSGLNALQAEYLAKQLQAHMIPSRIEPYMANGQYRYSVRVQAEHGEVLKDELKKTLIDFETAQGKFIMTHAKMRAKMQELIKDAPNQAKSITIYDAANPEHHIDLMLGDEVRAERKRMVEIIPSQEGKLPISYPFTEEKKLEFTQQLEAMLTKMEEPIFCPDPERYNELLKEDIEKLKSPYDITQAAYTCSAILTKDGADHYLSYNLKQTRDGLAIEPTGGFMAGDDVSKDTSLFENVVWPQAIAIDQEIKIEENIDIAFEHEYGLEAVDHDGHEIEAPERDRTDRDSDGIVDSLDIAPDDPNIAQSFSEGPIFADRDRDDEDGEIVFEEDA